MSPPPAARRSHPTGGEPVAARRSHAVRSARPPEPRRSGPTRVLLIEDDPADAALVRHHLERAGEFDLEVAESLERGLDLIGRRAFDVLLIDLGLPATDGLDAVVQVTGRCTDVPVIALSRNGDDRIAVQVVQRGAQDCLRKEDLDPVRLERAIQFAIGRQRHEARLKYQAGHDPLTGLANRMLFRDRLAQALSRARRARSRLAVMFLDLDRFKAVNDRLGHAAGDRLLEQIAHRLDAALREEDTVARFASTNETVARLGGDEFAILLEDLPSEAEAARVADRVIRAMTGPVDLGDEVVRCGSSVGISVFPQDAGSVDTLLECADVAMYRAKARGRSGFEFFTRGRRSGTAASASLEHALQRAVEEEQFELRYQPQVDLRTGTTVGVEALVRWRRGPEDLALPAEFLPTLVQAGHSIALGRWVLRTACRDLVRASVQGPLGVAVKITAQQLDAEGLFDSVVAALDATRLAPERLQLEVTEWVAAQDEERALDVLGELHQLGVGIAIEHFGVGRSSFAFLKHCPLDALKMDRSFVVDVEMGGREAAVAAAMIHMGHDLGLTVVAEGIEREAQLRFLRDRGCDVGQGYLLGRPDRLDAVLTDATA